MRFSTFSRRSLAACALLLAAASAQAADEARALAGLPLPPAGLVATATEVNKMDMKMTITAGGKATEATMVNTEDTRDMRTFLGPDQFTKKVDLVSGTTSMTIGGQVRESPIQAKPLDKVPVTYTRKDGKWELTLPGGGPLTDEQLASIHGRKDPFDADAAIYGTTLRKVGDKWEVDLSKLPNFGGMTHLTGKMSGELIEFKEVQGLPAAMVKLTFDVSGSDSDTDAAEATRTMHFKGESTYTLCTQYALELASENQGEMEAEIPSKNGSRVKMSGPVSMKSTVEVKKP